jgi:hypothetical protein
MTVKERYDGIQTAFFNANRYACLFLSLLSIAEDVTGNPSDFIGMYKLCLKKHWIDKEFACLDQCAILKYLTGKTWKREVLTFLPLPVPDNMYTVEKWYNPRTKFTHFKRRFVDTITGSITVSEGKIKKYYCYTMED